MSPRATWGLAAVLAALLVYLLVFDRPPQPIEGPPLLAATPATVRRLAVRWTDARLVAERADEGWRDAQGAPLAAPVDDVLRALATVHPVLLGRPGPREEADYGLATPHAHLEAEGRGGTLLAIDVGARNPSWTGVYVRRTGSPDVLLVGALLAWELTKLRRAAVGPSTGPKRLTSPDETSEPLRSPKEGS